MNIKNNRRKKESIERLERAFIELLQENGLDKVSVSDICANAGLNRSTFYSNYLDVYDMADKVKKHLEEDFLDLYAQERQSGESSYNFLKLFYHIRENQLFYKTYFKLSTGNDFALGYDVARANKYFEGKFIDYHIEFFKAGFNAILKKWLSGGCKETPEEMEQILKNEYLRKLYF